MLWFWQLSIAAEAIELTRTLMTILKVAVIIYPCHRRLIVVHYDLRQLFDRLQLLLSQLTNALQITLLARNKSPTCKGHRYTCSKFLSKQPCTTLVTFPPSLRTFNHLLKNSSTTLPKQLLTYTTTQTTHPCKTYQPSHQPLHRNISNNLTTRSRTYDWRRASPNKFSHNILLLSFQPPSTVSFSALNYSNKKFICFVERVFQ